MHTDESTAVGGIKAAVREQGVFAFRYIRSFLTWLAAGLLIGAAGGVVGGAFSLTVSYVTGLRAANPWILYLLPVGGLLIAAIYRRSGLHPGDTNGVLLALHTPARISLGTGPAIFLAAGLSHMLGASVGREGAALQLGGVLGHAAARLLHVPDETAKGLILCGMSAVFAALFGTPLAAAIFAIEVASVGLLNYSAIVPCLTSSFTAVFVAESLGAVGDSFPLAAALPFRGGSIAGVVVIAAVVGVMSIVYCISFRFGEHWLEKLLPNPFLRILAGGTAIVLLTLLFGTDYNGAGMPMIEHAMAGHARPEAFLVKLLFTVISVSAGYKGGEIVPCMFIGSSLGCVLAPLVGLDPTLGAAVGLLSMFCGSLNCPIASILLGAELFGAANLNFFAVACAVSYMLSANFSLYREQKIVYSKLFSRVIDQYAR